MDYLEMTKQVVRPKRMNAKGEERSLLWSDINGSGLGEEAILLTTFQTTTNEQ